MPVEEEEEELNENRVEPCVLLHQQDISGGGVHLNELNEMMNPMDPFVQLQKSPKIARRYFLDVSIISIVLRLFDLFFLFSNSILAYNYYEQNEEYHYYGNLTVTLTVVPTILLTFVSCIRAVHNVKKSKNLGITENHHKTCNNACQVMLFVLFPQIGAYYKLLEIINATTKHSKDIKPQYFYYVIHLKDESTMLYFASNFLQSTSQFVLQGYLLFTGKRTPYLETLQITSLVSSILCLTCATAASEQKSLLSVEWVAIISAFFWKLFSLVSRMLCLILLATVSIPSFILFCVIHAFLFSVLVTWKSNFVKSRCQSLILSPLIGTIYIFDDVNISYGKFFRNHILYYTVVFGEGVFIVFLWMFNSKEITWHHYWISVAIYATFFMGIVFFRLLYEYYNMHNVQVPMFDCVFGYQIFDEDDENYVEHKHNQINRQRI